MSRRRWMKSVIETADSNDIAMPWARGSRRARWKSAARKRAHAA
ncbi:hypothetical protein [Maritimibacter fusiformis]|nr:hypothetical protein [Maritimibacter fusiformis]